MSDIEVPRRPGMLVFTTLFGALFGGAGTGLAVAAWVAPDSDVASVLSFMLLPTALVVGFYAWLGVAFLMVLPGLVRRLSGRARSAPPNEYSLPPGEWVFLPVASILGLLCGIMVGILSAASSVPFAATAFSGVSTMYGGALWRLARAGYLPFPNPE